MCTAISYKTKDHYFGRNLDLEYRFDEQVTITPREYPFRYRNGSADNGHFAMIGMATIADNYPLYYDATNEYGLSMAGLNFPDNAAYNPPHSGKDNIAPFELIPWVLGRCKTAKEARMLLERTNITNVTFNDQLPLSPLHFMICDKEEALVAEPVKDGLKLYDNPVKVLTNNPPFPFHMDNLGLYIGLSPDPPENRFSPALTIKNYSTGMGAIGLPGDLSSASRFIRVAFVLGNSVSDATEDESISQFFHILSSVEQQRGCSVVNGRNEITLYSSCCNTDRCIYYYTTYENRQITAVHLFHEDLNGNTLTSYPLMDTQQIHHIN